MKSAGALDRGCPVPEKLTSNATHLAAKLEVTAVTMNEPQGATWGVCEGRRTQHEERRGRLASMRCGSCWGHAMVRFQFVGGEDRPATRAHVSFVSSERGRRVVHDSPITGPVTHV
jgi:hypothetical protein